MQCHVLFFFFLNAKLASTESQAPASPKFVNLHSLTRVSMRILKHLCAPPLPILGPLSKSIVIVLDFDTSQRKVWFIRFHFTILVPSYKTTIGPLRFMVFIPYISKQKDIVCRHGMCSYRRKYYEIQYKALYLQNQ